MKSLSPSPENCRRNGVIGLGLVPGHGPATISIILSHGVSQYEVALPSNSSFAYLRSVISSNIGLKPETYKFFFGGVEWEDEFDLRKAGVMNYSEVLLVEVTESEQKIPEEVQETCVISKGEDAVAEVRKEVDKLVQQVFALQAVVDSGNKVDDKEIIYLTEMLMRQLLKLDGIEAEGEGKVQRKMEVRRVQSIVETLDALKSRNSNSFRNTQESLSVSTKCMAFDSGNQNVNTPSPMQSSSLSPLPHFRPSTMPSSTFAAAPYFVPSAMPSSCPSPVPYFMPPTVPSSTFSAVPYCVPSPVPYFTPSIPPFSTPSSQPYYPSPISYFTPSPTPYHGPSHMPSSAPFSVPSSSQVTQNWEHFE